jgi:hypothetical protein
MKQVALINVLNEMCNQDQVYIFFLIYFLFRMARDKEM